KPSPRSSSRLAIDDKASSFRPYKSPELVMESIPTRGMSSDTCARPLAGAYTLDRLPQSRFGLLRLIPTDQRVPSPAARASYDARREHRSPQFGIHPYLRT